MWRPLRMVLMAVMKQHVSTKGLGFQGLRAFCNSTRRGDFFRWSKTSPKRGVSSCFVTFWTGVLTGLTLASLELYSSLWWFSALGLGEVKKNEEKPRIQQRFFFSLYIEDIEKKSTFQRLRKMCLFVGGSIYIEFVGNKTYYWGACRGRYQLGNVSPKHASSVGPTQKWMGFQRGKPKHQQRWVLGLGIQDQSPSDLSYNK